MRYGLVMVTHGKAEALADVLSSFNRFVTPTPTVRVCVVDGRNGLKPDPQRGVPWQFVQHPTQQGFCGATRTAWNTAKAIVGEHDLDYVFWLENDFLFVRPVRLVSLADVLKKHPVVAQMSLMRQPVNPDERRAGSVKLARPGAFVDHSTWMEQTAYWTTNPSLIPASTVREYEWPTSALCEGQMGIMLRSDARTFGVWGDGSTWVQHAGERDGVGYGY